MIVYLVRHGETAINKQYRFLGHFDVDLSTEGVKQAEIAAYAISDAVKDTVNIKGNLTLYSSDLARTIQTAGIVARGLQTTAASRNNGAITGASEDDNTAIEVSRIVEVRSTKDLREIDFGDWEGLTYDEIKSVDGAQFDAWLADYTSVKIPGGENWADFTSRITDAVLDILENAGKDDIIVVVTHGGPIRLITSCFIDDADHFQNFWPAPGSVHMLDVVKRVIESGGGRGDDICDSNACACYGAGKNNHQTVACLKLSRAYKLDNYRFNLQIS
jgi:broad specificity phosphatase PhoE